MNKNIKRAMGLGQILSIMLVALIGAFTLVNVKKWINNARDGSNKTEAAFKNLFDDIEEKSTNGEATTNE